MASPRWDKATPCNVTTTEIFFFSLPSYHKHITLNVSYFLSHRNIVNNFDTSFLHALPSRRAKHPTIWDLLVRHTSVVGSLGVHSIAPPCLNRVEPDRPILRVLKSKEDDEGADAIARIQSSR